MLKFWPDNLSYFLPTILTFLKFSFEEIRSIGAKLKKDIRNTYGLLAQSLVTAVDQLTLLGLVLCFD